MKDPDFATSCLKTRRHLMLIVRSSSTDRDESTCSSGAFNLNCFNSLNQGVRLNHIKLNR